MIMSYKTAKITEKSGSSHIVAKTAITIVMQQNMVF